jgi:hypothetical protein
MLTEPQRDHVRTVARTVQIIVGAMGIGVATFFGIAILLVQQHAQFARAGSRGLTYASIAVALLVTVAYMIVPRLIGERMRQAVIDGKSDDWGIVKNMPNADKLGDLVPIMAIYQTRMIVGIALLEGAAFLACIAYLFEHRRITIIIAAALLVGILSQLPTFARVEAWAEDELAETEQLRQLQ